MDPQVQASFIPKKPLDDRVARRSGGMGFLFFIALLFFIASLIAAAAAFLYQGYLGSAIAKKSHDLQLAEGAFEPPVIEDLIRIDSRINNAKKLLNKHVATSAVFNFLSEQTLQNVQFKSFEYTLQEDGSTKIMLIGQADNFSTVALQSDQFGGSKVLKDVIFSDLTINSGGSVTFSVTALVDPALTNYAQRIEVNGASTQNTTPVVPVIETIQQPVGTTTTP